MLRRLPGFTLIEVLVSIGILSIIVGISVPYSLNFYQSYTLRSERNALLTMMTLARDQSLNNANTVAHGVKVTSTSYVGFDGASYANRDQSRDVVFPRSSVVTITGTTEFVFSPLTAQTTTASVTLTNSRGTQTITANAEGMIDW